MYMNAKLGTPYSTVRLHCHDDALLQSLHQSRARRNQPKFQRTSLLEASSTSPIKLTTRTYGRLHGALIPLNMSGRSVNCGQ